MTPEDQVFVEIRRARVAARQRPSLAQNVAAAILGGILLLTALYLTALVLDRVMPPEVTP
jgi:hypothetical protein